MKYFRTKKEEIIQMRKLGQIAFQIICLKHSLKAASSCRLGFFLIQQDFSATKKLLCLLFFDCLTSSEAHFKQIMLQLDPTTFAKHG